MSRIGGSAPRDRASTARPARPAELSPGPENREPANESAPICRCIFRGTPVTEHESQLHAEYFERYRKVGRSLLQQAADAFSEPERPVASTPRAAPEVSTPLGLEAARASPTKSAVTTVASPPPVAPATEHAKPAVSNGVAAPSTPLQLKAAASTADPAPAGGETSAPASQTESDAPAEREPHASVTNRILARGPANKPRTSDTTGSQQLVSSLRRRVLGANAAAQTAVRTDDGSTRLLGGRDGALARFRRRRFGV